MYNPYCGTPSVSHVQTQEDLLLWLGFRSFNNVGHRCFPGITLDPFHIFQKVLFSRFSDHENQLFSPLTHPAPVCCCLGAPKLSFWLYSFIPTYFDLILLIPPLHPGHLLVLYPPAVTHLFPSPFAPAPLIFFCSKPSSPSLSFTL